VKCPGSSAMCAGSQCCADGSTCPSADPAFSGCQKPKLVDCTGSTATVDDMGMPQLPELIV
jgi:hypothetical protein